MQPVIRPLVSEQKVTQQVRTSVRLPNAYSSSAFDLTYWGELPLNWARQLVRNGSDILRVLDMIHFRPLPAGMVSLDHPWVTGISPQTGNLVWPANVIYRTAPRSDRPEQRRFNDDAILCSIGRFLAARVRQSAILPELPLGSQRRMPHVINYMHGSSHYNSGIILLNDFAEGYRLVNDKRFREELKRFVRSERREVLFVFRDRDYSPREYAYFSCCLRTRFPWFCSANGPKARVLWGNSAPFPVANLITGCWTEDIARLKQRDGALKVIRPVIGSNYFQAGEYGVERNHSRGPDRFLAWVSFFRVKARGGRGGMYFIDRRKVFADQIAKRKAHGLADENRASFF